MAARKVGLRNVAERAGVALSTVSHVLNGTASISEPVRRKVLEAAREVGYLEQRRAQGAIATLGTVLLAVPEDALPSSSVNLVSWTILNALNREAERRGVRLVPHHLTADQAPGALAAAVADAQADAVIVLNDDREPLLAAIRERGIPAVLINGEDPEMHVDSVTPGNRFAARQATRRLLALGHRRIMHLTWRGRKTIARRLDGFRDAMAEAGLGGAAPVLMADGFTPGAGEKAVRGWLDAHPDLDGVTGLFCAADNLAFGAMQALRDRGLSVPADLSVMGFDGVALGELHVPPLTTVSVPLDEFGREALELLERRLSAGGVPRAAHRVELGCRIVERQSVGSPRKA
ncbi:MAG: LacI family transcriptional regulator [Rhodobacteraceae bacterium]|jgi:DNA-binding LacI/PurR family transcriptional regulator|nr:LacI family transcriptional regulator [Paracoccaceae bacterium]